MGPANPRRAGLGVIPFPSVRTCSKPTCGGPATVVLAYDYGSRMAVLEDAADGSISPHLYALCTCCADRLQAPRGWQLVDRRMAPRLFVTRDSLVP